MLAEAIYNPQISYEENFQNGPFGAFAESGDLRPDLPKFVDNFLGLPVNLPFGVPAGPLVNSNFVEAALRFGFDLPVYKTVRTALKGCHSWPNVVQVEVEGDLDLAKAAEGLISCEDFKHPLAITNSFGVPSPDPDWWQEDLHKAVEAAGPGQAVIASFQGTKTGEGEAAFIADHVTCSRLIAETGAKLMVMNLSCPNEGTANLLCYNVDLVERIAFAVKEEIGDRPLLLKIAYFESDQLLQDLILRLGKIVDGFVMINTIATNVRKPNGEQALPGEGRLRSGVCGGPIKWAGLDMVRRAVRIRDEQALDFVVVGVGGVMGVDDYLTYRKVGADAVLSATGMMWNPYLAKQIKESL